MIILWTSVILTVAILIGGFFFIYYFLAPRNIFFTFVEEGTAKIVIRARKFHKALIQWKGYTFERADFSKEWDVIPGKEFHLLGGIRFFGIWPLDRIFTYPFEWTGFRTDGTPLPHPKEILNYILLKHDVYFAKVENAEDKELLPLDISFVLTISIINPYKALFKVQNWLEMIINRTIPIIRGEVSQSIYAELIENLRAVSNNIQQTLSASDGLFGEFKKEYGVDVRKLEIQKIDPPEEQRKATLKEYEAKQEAKRTVVEAEAKARAIQLVYEKVKQFKELGKLIRTLEALEKGSSEGGKWILGIPGIGEIISKAFPEEGKS